MFDTFFGIDDLENNVQQFKIDIENAKATYINEYAEYINIATDFENIEQKDDFLHQESEALTKVFPEDTGVDRDLSSIAKGFEYSGTAFGTIAGISYIASRVYKYKFIKYAAELGKLRQAIAVGQSGKAGRILVGGAGRVAELSRLARIKGAAQIANGAKTLKAVKIAKITGAVGAVLGIVSVALDLAAADKRRDYLEEQKDELQKFLDEFNGYIAEANENTKTIVDAFLIYFNELEINVDGVFNDNKDELLDGEKFETAVGDLRGILNGSIKRMGELKASIGLANKRMARYIDKEYKGKELIEEVVWDTELPEELVQRLYIIKLREAGSTVQEAIELSGVPEKIVRKVYARGYLDDGKTVQDTVRLSSLTEDEVRRVYASKLLDDQLESENPDDVLDVKGIADQAGLSEEVVREIRIQKLNALPSSSESESP